jgi:DNA-binding MarR family transcriptional regulator
MTSAPRPTDERVIGDAPFAVELHLALVRAYEAAIHANVRHIARWGLTPQQYNAIRIVYFGEAYGVRLTDLGERLLQRVPDVSRLVDRLETAGLARRSPDPDDRRAMRVKLTAKGRRLLTEMDPQLMTAHERWYAALTPAEQRRLESLLRKAAAAIESAGEDDQPASPDSTRR